MFIFQLAVTVFLAMIITLIIITRKGKKKLAKVTLGLLIDPNSVSGHVLEIKTPDGGILYEIPTKAAGLSCLIIELSPDEFDKMKSEIQNPNQKERQEKVAKHYKKYKKNLPKLSLYDQTYFEDKVQQYECMKDGLLPELHWKPYVENISCLDVWTARLASGMDTYKQIASERKSPFRADKRMDAFLEKCKELGISPDKTPILPESVGVLIKSSDGCCFFFDNLKFCKRNAIPGGGINWTPEILESLTTKEEYISYLIDESLRELMEETGIVLNSDWIASRVQVNENSTSLEDIRHIIRDYGQGGCEMDGIENDSPLFFDPKGFNALAKVLKW